MQGDIQSQGKQGKISFFVNSYRQDDGRSGVQKRSQKKSLPKFTHSAGKDKIIEIKNIFRPRKKQPEKN